MARKQYNIHYIYKTTCNVTGRWYIGMHSTYNIDDNYMGSGTVLRRSIRKYGVENHTKEILEFCETRELLVLREREIVTKELISDGLCMNLKEGGFGGLCNEEHRIKFLNAGNDKLRKLLEDESYKNEHCIRLENARKQAFLDGKIVFINNSFSWIGKNHSEETKQLLSEVKKGTGIGENNSQFGTCWITKHGLNKKIKKEDLNTFLNEGWIKGRK